jgi:hypothetical protein
MTLLSCCERRHAKIVSLIAIMLGRLRMDVDSCIDAYIDLSDAVFQKVKHRVTLGGKVQGRFDSAELERAIKTIVQSQIHDENALLKDEAGTNCKVSVPFQRKCITLNINVI